MNKGSCLCRQITFEISQFESAIAHCHCNMCRKFHGAAFSTLAEVQNKHIKWLSGQALLKHYTAENNTQRLFCQHCGSSLAFISPYNKQDDTLEIALGCLDTVSDDIIVKNHIFVTANASWYDINDQLPQYQKFRDKE